MIDNSSIDITVDILATGFRERAEEDLKKHSLLYQILAKSAYFCILKKKRLVTSEDYKPFQFLVRRRESASPYIFLFFCNFTIITNQAYRQKYRHSETLKAHLAAWRYE